MANFGFSIGDIVTVGSLAWSVYKACSNASSEFQEVAREVISLHAAVKQLEEESADPDSAIHRSIEQKSQPLQTLIENIGQVLGQLDSLVLKYQSLNTKDRRKRDVVRFTAEGLDDIRTKVILHTGTVHLYLGSVSVGSLGRIESKLDEIVKELRSGQRDVSAIAVSDDEDDPTARQQWRALREELVEDGFQKEDLDNHKVWIKAQLRRRIAGDQRLPREGQDMSDRRMTVASPSRATSTFTNQDLIDPTPRNIYDTRATSNSSDRYGFPPLRRSPSVSSMTSVHSEVSEHDSNGHLTKRAVTITTTTTYHSASATDDSETSDRRDSAGPAYDRHRTLPRPHNGTQAYLPPAPTSMMGQFSSKMSWSTQKKHKCKLCDKRFIRPSSLQIHMYSHTGEKPFAFACLAEGCSRRFSVKSNLRRHMKVHSRETLAYDADSDRSVLSD